MIKLNGFGLNGRGALERGQETSEDIRELFTLPPWDLGSGRMSSFHLKSEWPSWWRASF